MRLFKSALRKRIEIAIILLKADLDKTEAEKLLYTTYKNAPEMCKCIVRKNDIIKQIELLKRLL
jgi:hypothetical protein